MSLSKFWLVSGSITVLELGFSTLSSEQSVNLTLLAVLGCGGWVVNLLFLKVLGFVCGCCNPGLVLPLPLLTVKLVMKGFTKSILEFIARTL